MKKRRLPCLIILVLTLLLILSGCGAKEKSESEIASDLSANPSFYPTQNVTISDVRIIKRQTNKKEKTDYIYVDVKAQNENIECSLSYKLYYCLYNEGWILDSVTPYESHNWEITPLSGPMQEQADNAMQKYGTYTYLHNDLDLADKICTYYYSTTKEYSYAEQETTIAVDFYFDDSSAEWVQNSFNIVDIKTTWDVSGNWYPDGSSWYDRYYMKITEVNDETIHVVVFNSSTNEIYFAEDVTLTSEGADFDVAVSNSGWDTLDMFIEVDRVYVEGRGTRSNCLYIR